ncbi:MAG: Gfo/Idh/MocA family oxidoreductase [Planctomycetota bacterium]
MAAEGEQGTRVRIGVVGVGSMGAAHCRTIQDGKAGRLELTAAADHTPERLDALPESVARFGTAEEMIASTTVDAILVATPHFDHVPIGVAALEAGLHVLVEKPIGVHAWHTRPLIDAAEAHPDRVFAAMFNQRTDPRYIELKRMISAGELGALRRLNWIITNWFRTEAYYQSGGWRATWAGEGGGVLLNQCPHNLDLWQWLFGMPDRVRGFCTLGRFHDIEVEDDVTAYLEYEDGTTGVFITTTGEAPGTNRLEVVGEHGKVVLEGSELRFTRNAQPTTEFSRTSPERFGAPATTDISYRFNTNGPQHAGILQNFADAILDGAPLIAPGVEGIRSVELANAMLLSSLEGETVALPLDGERFLARFDPLVRGSCYDPSATPLGTVSDDMAGSFSR